MNKELITESFLLAVEDFLTEHSINLKYSVEYSAKEDRKEILELLAIIERCKNG